MSLFWAIAFGGLGLRFGTLGAVGGGTAAPPPEPGATGSPIGLLLVLTYA